MIVDPWGTVLCESTHVGPEVLQATLDMDDVSRRRGQIAVLGLRRPDLYDGDVRRVVP